MPLNHRACCCGPGGDPPGGWSDCDGPDYGIKYRIVNQFGEIEYLPSPANFIPKWFNVTLPQSLDLTGWVDLTRQQGARPFVGEPIISLCPEMPTVVVMQENCFNERSSFANYFPRPGGGFDLFGPHADTIYRVPGAACPVPLMEWRYGLSVWPPTSITGTDFGERTGYLYTRLRLNLIAVAPNGGRVTVLLECWRILSAITWTDFAFTGEIPNAVTLALETDLLTGQLAVPNTLFNGPWYFGFGCDDAPTPKTQSFDPARRLIQGYTDGGCGPDLFVGGIIAQAGNSSLPGTPSTASVVYVPPSQTEQCVSGELCAPDCYATLFTTGFGPFFVGVDCLPRSLSLRLPETITVDYRDGGCGNFGAVAPAPWTRTAPETATYSLFIDPATAPNCGADVSCGPVAQPWRGIVSPATNAWENIGIAVTGTYRPGVACEGETNFSVVQLSVGFALLSPLTVALEDRNYQLFTMAAVTPFVERLDGAQFGNAGSLYAINLGPTFRLGDYATVPVQEGDPIRTFARLANAWDWAQDFVFEEFYFGYMPAVSSACDGYSFPPEAYTASVARTVSGIDDLADYCGQVPEYQVCARGANHIYPLRVVPSFGDATPLRSNYNMRYCSNGSPCQPPPACGTLLVTSEAPAVDSVVLDARTAQILDQHMQAAASRQAINRAVCQSCPANEYDAGGEYCRIAYRTCRCATPAKRAKEKTTLWQRNGLCPRGYFQEAYR